MRVSLGVCFLMAMTMAVATPAAAQTSEPMKVDGDAPGKVVIRPGAELFERQWKPASASEFLNSILRRFASGVPDASGSGDATIPQRPLTLSRAGSSRLPPFRNTGKPGDGLGPLHNAVSCAECHRDGGAAGVEHNVTLIAVDPRSPAVIKRTKEHGEDLFQVFPGLLDERGGLLAETVVHDRSTRGGYRQIRRRIVEHVPDGVKDAWFEPAKRTSRAIAQQPVVAGRFGGVDFYLSQRNPPPLFGLGQIDRISENYLERLAQAQAKRTDGRISGRVAGKFGWRGQINSLSAFVVMACAGELGLSNSAALQRGDPADLSYAAPGFDMTNDEVRLLTQFVASVPKPREKVQKGHAHSDVYAGEKAFNSIGCAECHTPDVHPVSDLFSDLLLHDMGERLQAPSPAPNSRTTMASKVMTATRTYPVRGPTTGASRPYYSGGSRTPILPAAEPIARPDVPRFPRGPRPEKPRWSDPRALVRDDFHPDGETWDDLQREWRTPPLWGVADTAPYLHDGRAETLEEAILWHGGEAQDSRDRFEQLDSDEKRQLIVFLSSLRAP